MPIETLFDNKYYNNYGEKDDKIYDVYNMKCQSPIDKCQTYVVTFKEEIGVKICCVDLNVDFKKFINKYIGNEIIPTRINKKDLIEIVNKHSKNTIIHENLEKDIKIVCDYYTTYGYLVINNYTIHGFKITENIPNYYLRTNIFDGTPTDNITSEIWINKMYNILMLDTLLFDKDVVVYRGVSKYQNFIEHSIIHANYFLSTSLSLRIAMKFFRDGQTGKMESLSNDIGNIFVITIPAYTGVFSNFLYGIDYEAEIIIHCGSIFYITKVEGIYVYMVLIGNTRHST